MFFLIVKLSKLSSLQTNKVVYCSVLLRDTYREKFQPHMVSVYQSIRGGKVETPTIPVLLHILLFVN